MEPWPNGCGAGAAQALDRWCAGEQCLVSEWTIRSTGCEPNAVSVLHQLQPRKGLVFDLLTDHHCQLECPKRESVGCARRPVALDEYFVWDFNRSTSHWLFSGTPCGLARRPPHRGAYDSRWLSSIQRNRSSANTPMKEKRARASRAAGGHCELLAVCRPLN